MILLSTNWKNLATAEAQSQGAELNIVLATVDAETSGRNISGDNGNAIGYGQVWPKWHLDAFHFAANKYRVSLPPTLEGKMQLALNNDAFSMCVAVFVIKQTWLSTGRDFRKFSLAYVGPAIPDSDYNRRYNIWLKYKDGKNNTFNETGSSSNTGGPITSTSNPQFDVNIPVTNYGVDPSSRTLGNVLYGRKYRIIVSDKNGTALDVSNLKCTFNIQKTMLQPPNFSSVTIYNLSAATENAIINEGSRIIVEAGYEGNGNYGVIFDGDVIQPVRDKEDGVTYKLTLNSMDGERFLNQGFVSFALIKGQTSREIIDNLVSKAKVSTELGSISDNLDEAQLTRGKAVFGLAKDYLRQLAQTHNASFYVEDGKVNLIRVADLPEGEIIDLSPDSGLIGTPAQNSQGLTFKCLLNPLIKVNSLVHIDNRTIKAQTFQSSQTILRSLDSEGIYRVVGITYRGDTRGDDWYCECEAVSQAGLLPGMMGTPTANPN